VHPKTLKPAKHHSLHWHEHKNVGHDDAPIVSVDGLGDGSGGERNKLGISDAHRQFVPVLYERGSLSVQLHHEGQQQQQQ
jgi:hypothetical protein